MKAKLYKTLCISPNGLSYRELASKTLKSKDISESLGRRIFEPILSGEANFVQEESGLWHVREPADPADRFLGNLTYVVVDLETTGYPVPEEGVTEIGAVKVQGERWIEEFHALVNPGRYVPVAVQRLTGISNTLLRSSPRIAEILPGFARFCEGAVLVAHNAPFDLRILQREAAPLGVALPEWSFCTYSLARRLLPELESYRLGDLARNLGFPDEGSHRALPDARTAARLFSRLMVDLLSLGIETLGGALRFLQAKRPPRPGDAPRRRRVS